MLIKIITIVLSSLIFSACMDSNVLFDMQSELSNNSRFSIDSYTEAASLSGDLSGLWVSIHNGQLLEKNNGVDFDVSGFIREIVEIRYVNGGYQLRSCMEPESVNTLAIAGDQITVRINNDVASLTRVSNTLMSGSASHSEASSSYSGTLQMKKVAALDTTLGTFSFYNDAHAIERATASCFQEALLHVVGKKFGISQWSSVEALVATDWTSGSAYKQSNYLFSRSGSADPAKQLSFMAGVIGGISYDMTTSNVAVAASQKSVNSFNTSFEFDASQSGVINLEFNIGKESSGIVVTLPEVSLGDDEGAGTIGSEWWKDVWADWFPWWSF